MSRFHRLASFFALVVLVGLGAAGCKQDNGERCEQGSDCASGYCGSSSTSIGMTSAKGMICTPDSKQVGSPPMTSVDASTTTDASDAGPGSDAADVGSASDASDAKADASDAGAGDASEAGSIATADGSVAETGGDASGSDGAVDGSDAGTGG
jgi:hypothetical protein